MQRQRKSRANKCRNEIARDEKKQIEKRTQADTNELVTRFLDSRRFYEENSKSNLTVSFRVPLQIGQKMTCPGQEQYRTQTIIL